jgi:hypothetical protein
MLVGIVEQECGRSETTGFHMGYGWLVKRQKLQLGEMARRSPLEPGALRSTGSKAK